MLDLEVLIVAVVFAACHFLSPLAFRAQERARRVFSSVSGGFAAAYVFLHLLPEIEEGGELLGERVYFVVLVGLALYYGLEIVVHRSGRKGADLAIHLSTAGLYSAMLVFTLATQLPESSAMTFVFAGTMGLHLVSGDVGLQERYGERFVRVGRFVLVGAVAAGFALSLVRDPHPAAIDALTALLAGMMIFTVFRKELPEFRDAHFGAFLAGMLLFLGAHVALERAAPEEAEGEDAGVVRAAEPPAPVR